MQAKISMGLALVGSIAAPAGAVTTQTFNLANDGSGFTPITIGGNIDPQFSYTSLAVFDSKNGNFAYFVARFGASSGAFLGQPQTVQFIGGLLTAPLPAPGAAFPFDLLNVGTTDTKADPIYVPLKFQINGVDMVGNAFFTGTGTTYNTSNGTFVSQVGGLDRIEYATAAAAVPEPAVWVELLAGFAMAGAAVRRRRQSREALAA